MRWLWLPLYCWLLLPAGAADQPAVRLGLVVPAAGDAGAAAQSMRRAADMAVGDWAPRLGRPVELSVLEDFFDPRQAVALAGC